MAKLKVEATTWSNGRQLKPHYRLGDSEATAVLTSPRTLVKAHLFADGSGLVILTRGAERQAFELSAEDQPLTLTELTDGALTLTDGRLTIGADDAETSAES